MGSTYKVEGMTCGGCAQSVTKAIQRAAPAVSVEVDLAQGKVKVEGAHEEAKVRQAVEAAGFDWAGPA